MTQPKTATIFSYYCISIGCYWGNLRTSTQLYERSLLKLSKLRNEAWISTLYAVHAIQIQQTLKGASNFFSPCLSFSSWVNFCRIYLYTQKILIIKTLPCDSHACSVYPPNILFPLLITVTVGPLLSQQKWKLEAAQPSREARYNNSSLTLSRPRVFFNHFIKVLPWTAERISDASKAGFGVSSFIIPSTW